MKKPLKRGSYTNQMAFAVWNIARNNKQRSGGSAEPLPQETMLTMTNSTLTEESTSVGFIVSTYTLTVYSGEAVTVGFANGSNSNGYYEIVGNDVKLTTAGFNALNLGTVMPNAGLATSDSVTKYNQVTTILIDDPTYLTVNDGTITKGTTVAGNVVCTFTASDEDDALTFDFTSGTNTSGYYAISGLNVLITTAGVTYLNNRNQLPNVSITTNTGVTVVNTVTTILASARHAPDFDGVSSYIKFTDEYVFSGAFYLSGYFTIVPNGCHFFASQGSSRGRVYVNGVNKFFQMANTDGAARTTYFTDTSWMDGEVHFIEIANDASGTAVYSVDGNVIASGNGIQGGQAMTINSVGAQWSNATSTAYLSGLGYDININNTEFWSFDELWASYPTLTSDLGRTATAYNFVSSQVVEIDL